MDHQNKHRIVVIGAGPAGCSCAISLLNTGNYEVYILDNSKGGKFHIGESIPPEMNPILRQLDIYKAFLNQGHEACYGSCSYWGSHKRGYNDSLLSPHGHGWHLDRARFNEFLVKESEQRGANVLKGASFLQSEKEETGHRIHFRDTDGNKHHIKADFVVDASGGRAVFASSQGSNPIYGTPLVCLGIRFKNKGHLPVSKLTHLESVAHGWWYAARIPGEYMLVTFYTTAAVVKQLGLNDLKNWFYLLADSPKTFDLVAKMEPVETKIRGFKAQSFCRDTVSGKDWLAVGDAAATYDPITSQGIIKAFTHGMRAAELIPDHLAGNFNALDHYRQEVKEQYAYYLKSRGYFYSLEKRWPESLFWATLQQKEDLAAIA